MLKGLTIQTLNKNQTVTINHRNSTSISSGLGISFGSLLTANQMKIEESENLCEDYIDFNNLDCRNFFKKIIHIHKTSINNIEKKF